MHVAFLPLTVSLLLFYEIYPPSGRKENSERDSCSDFAYNYLDSGFGKTLKIKARFVT